MRIKRVKSTNWAVVEGKVITTFDTKKEAEEEMLNLRLWYRGNTYRVIKVIKGGKYE